MDFRVLLAVGITFGISLAAPLAGSADGPWPRNASSGASASPVPAWPACPQTPVPHGVGYPVRTDFIQHSSSLTRAVFRSALHRRQAEGARLSGHLDELPLKEHLPVWVF
ncbi:hypothetical protein [Pseudomonas asplenii]|uniref:Uncharacterized protein n=1 Tax=Pseudomonas asplenii TaxID=53407 RepID=A0A0M9GFN4_9PSED|nr:MULTISPECIES: hypothetical protein [Pseudomonas]KPA89997.1 hypothetical protein PF66_03459 [Pseudomonas fuscovaginae]KPA95335.1 hypothetical protein PF70_04674 [Pseudomonas fuscovaginae]